jgi:hypothetical protein
LFVIESQNRQLSFLDLQDHKTRSLLFSLQFATPWPRTTLAFRVVIANLTAGKERQPLGTQGFVRLVRVVSLVARIKLGGAAFSDHFAASPLSPL